MKRIRILLIAVALAACGGTPKSDGPKRYRAWCNTQSRYVGEWRNTREEADADRQAHLKMYGWHAVRIDVGG